MKLKAWIDLNGGPSAVARILNVKKSTVSQWYHFKALPRDRVKLDIMRISRGKVKIVEDIIRPFAEFKKWS